MPHHQRSGRDLGKKRNPKSRRLNPNLKELVKPRSSSSLAVRHKTRMDIANPIRPVSVLDYALEPNNPLLNEEAEVKRAILNWRGFLQNSQLTPQFLQVRLVELFNTCIEHDSYSWWQFLRDILEKVDLKPFRNDKELYNLSKNAMTLIKKSPSLTSLRLNRYFAFFKQPTKRIDSLTQTRRDIQRITVSRLEHLRTINPQTAINRGKGEMDFPQHKFEALVSKQHAERIRLFQRKLKDLRTVDDVLLYFLRTGNDEPFRYLYLRRVEDGSYYDLEFTLNESEADAVISADSIFFKNGDYINMEDFIRERNLYHLLRNLKIFKYFRQFKTLKFLKLWLRKLKFNNMIDSFKENSFLAREDYLNAYLQANKLIQQIDGNSFFFVFRQATAAAATLHNQTQAKAHEERLFRVADDFLNENLSIKRNLNEQVTMLVENLCSLITNLSNSIQYRLSRNLLISEQEGSSKSILELKQWYKTIRQAVKDARRDQAKLPDFICLLDLVYIHRLVADVAENLMFLTDVINPIFLVTVVVNDGFKFQPSEETLLHLFNRLFSEVETFTSELPRLYQQASIRGLFVNSSPQNCSPLSILLDSKEYQNVKDTISKVIKDSFSKTLDSIQEYRSFIEIQQWDRDFDEENYRTKQWTFEEFITCLDKFTNWLNELETISIRNILTGIIEVDVKSFLKELMPIPKKYIELTKIIMHENLKTWCVTLESRLRHHNSLLKTPENRIKDLPGFLDYLRDVYDFEDNWDSLKFSFNEISKLYEYLKDVLKVRLTITDINKHSEVSNLHANAHALYDSAKEYISVNRDSFISAHNTEIADFKQDILGFLTGNEFLTFLDPSNDAKHCLMKLSNVDEKIKAFQGQISTYHNSEDLLKTSHSTTHEFEQLKKQYDVNLELWTLYDGINENHNKWTSDVFLTGTSHETMNETITRLFKTLISLRSKVSGQDKVLNHLLTRVDQWKKNLVLIKELQNPALKERHWKKIFSLLGRDVQMDFTLDQMEFWGVFGIRSEILEVSSSALGEYVLELQIDKIKEGWRSTKFVVKLHHEGYVLSEIDEVSDLLEDNLITLSSLLNSRFLNACPELEAEIQTWEKKLKHFSLTLDEVLKCQRFWMYLEVILKQEDIKKQLPDEYEKFSVVDLQWVSFTRNLDKDPHAITVIDDVELLEKFLNANIALEEIQKSLEEYLETKRQQFPRFYFLSNDQLLQILSQTKNPHAVQEHMIKCFDGIKKLQFEGNKVLGLQSPEGEVVSLTKQVVATEQVEFWLGDVENAMKKTLHQAQYNAFIDSSRTKRSTWLFSHPSQTILTSDLLNWTLDVETALKQVAEGDRNATNRIHDMWHKRLLELVELVRGNLPKLHRSLLSTLTIIDVHSLEVLNQLRTDGISSINDFDWLKQLRFYWEDDNLKVRQTDAEFTSAYEYLGNAGRLVITPLTDRCYITLTSAMHYSLGGNPQGPAGTGKTETVKDLAKSLAVPAIVFNASDNISAQFVAKFLRGLCSVGAFSCFDEFNRIEIEVLSVIAQQLLTIQNALRSKVESFMFEGKPLSINGNFGVFITMNPGYAGRTELPDNLKACFRPISMMVPDYSLIAEIILYSQGFAGAKVLAKKMVMLYKLASEQLSQQKHYDYGMRAIKAVLVAAGSLKRDYAELPEDIVLIRALRDSNLPKFIANDVPLFLNIISDLFPGVEIPSVDYGVLREAIEEVLTRDGFQLIPAFVGKIQQLFETHIVRHGLMLVGLPATGKTVCLNGLANALTLLHEKGITEGPGCHHYRPVDCYKLNPKSLTMYELFGFSNPISYEWTDGLVGILANNVVDAAQNSDRKKFIVFDGPVDALWIENMNTVLDDNKMLCLANGQRIKLPDTVNAVFEVRDLSEASPATVSRCGMVYLGHSDLGWQAPAETWRARMDSLIPTSGTRLFKYLVDFVEDFDKFVKNECNYAVETLLITRVETCLSLMEALMTPYFPEKEQEIVEEGGDSEILARLKEQKQNKKDSEQLNLTPDEFDRFYLLIFIYSFYWSFGGSIDQESRVKFDKYFKQMYIVHKASSIVELPVIDSIFDTFIDFKQLVFVNWEVAVPKFKPIEDASFNQIVVPTLDSSRYSHLIELAFRAGSHILFVGESGTGKTVTVNQFSNKMDEEETMLTTVSNLSARTSSYQLQTLIESKWSRKRKTVLGAPPGKGRVLFVDDMNMPAKEEYGAQPPLELIRQIIDQGGFYDRKEFFFKEVVDTHIVGAMGPPGGGRTEISDRLVAKMMQIYMPQMTDSSIKLIFTKVLESLLDRFNSEVQGTISSIVNASLSVYGVAISTLLPTPSKSHYTFNLRDLSKIVQGVCSSSPMVVSSVDSVSRLWAHETQRVFYDRLTCDEDRATFNRTIMSHVHDHFGIEHDQIPDPDTLMFGDFVGGYSEARMYRESDSYDALVTVLDSFLEDFNITYPSMEVKYVFFRDAIRHILRISRILNTPRGNALLIGVGGSGRQTATRLAAHICGQAVFSVEITNNYGVFEFREDVKKVLMNVGAENEPSVFILNDTQVVDEGFLEDINNILNSGEIPDLWANDEISRIQNSIAPYLKEHGIPESVENCLSEFVHRVREGLHIVLCMSPVGSSFRSRVRQFPALVNCCSLDWFDKWPAEALNSVAHSQLEMEALVPQKLLNSVVEMCVHLQETVTNESTRYLDELRRHNYVTPASYLDLLETFRKTLSEQHTALHSQIDRLASGLDKLRQANSTVAEMQITLTKLQPQLEKAAFETEAKLVDLQKEEVVATEARDVVAAQKEIVTEKTIECEAIRDDAAADLAEAEPIYKAALKALETLDSQQISVVRTFKRPPADVKLVMEAVCVLMGVEPTWQNAQRQLADLNFLKNLQNYDKDSIPRRIRNKVKRQYISLEEFDPKRIQRVSEAANCLCQWVIAVSKYADVVEVVGPKRQALKEAESNLAVMQAELNGKQAELDEKETIVARLKASYQAALDKQNAISDDIEDTKIKLQRAEKLTSGLADEEKRWSEDHKIISARTATLIGDSLLSAGALIYLGPFNSSFRAVLVGQWKEKLDELDVVYTKDFSLSATIANPMRVRDWITMSLPDDPLSIDNACILTNASKWPLCIDPQTQANKWLKNLEKENTLRVCRLSDDKLLRTIENAIRIGIPVLLEDIEETLDPSLEPILLKRIREVGSRKILRLGDKDVDWNEDFRFFMTTKLGNPHYVPEIQIRVTLINFTVTQKGLSDQLLSSAIRVERPDLEQQKDQLVVQIADSQKALQKVEDDILGLLSSASGNLLDDEVLIQTLDSAKKTSVSVTKSLHESEETAKNIDKIRNEYRDLANRGSIIYFVVSDMSNVDPMYQWSLNFFVSLFNLVIEKTKTGDISVAERVKLLRDEVTYAVFQNVSRGLFVKDKVLFSYLLAVQLQRDVGKITEIEWNFFLRGNTTDKHVSRFNWMSDQQYTNFMGLSKFPGFASIISDLETNKHEWTAFFESVRAGMPHMPSNYSSNTLSSWQMLMLLSITRKEKVSLLVSEFVKDVLGKRFIEMPSFDLGVSFDDSTSSTPIIFILSAGADPSDRLMKFARDKQMDSRLRILSLGQGQGPIAEALIDDAILSGDWVFLQNCHLCTSWMPALERKLDALYSDTAAIHPEFRLFLTSMPSEAFPVPVLQQGVKLTNEPPAGLKANLRGLLSEVDESLCEDAPVEFLRLLYSLCFFHSSILERKRFGPLGWNIPYEWTFSDFHISVSMLHNTVTKAFTDGQELPWKQLHYMSSIINYGGRVTDSIDQRCLDTLLQRFIEPGATKAGFALTPDSRFSIPQADSLHGFIDFVQASQVTEVPEIYGLHNNANLSFQRAQTMELLNNVLDLQPRMKSSSALSPDELVMRASDEFLSQLPATLNVPDYKRTTEAMNTVLQQECARFNKLLVVIENDLKNLKRGIKGLVVMSEGLEQSYNSLLLNRVPNLWCNNAYPSVMSLANWFADLVRRVAFFRSWCKSDPVSYHLPAFFFPQGFLTAVLQRHARQTLIPIDSLVFKTHVLEVTDPAALHEAPKTGVHVDGLMLEGAQWNSRAKVITETSVRNLVSPMNVIWLQPLKTEDSQTNSNVYQCPVYKTPTRSGVLSTTGRSTNFILPLDLPSKHPQSHWIQRGVALLCQCFE
ncbi:hypothetical protein PCE1_003163 [Barthelona sp. PCE]